VLYFPRPTNRPEHNGLWVKVIPGAGQPWIGVFAFLFEAPDAFSQIISAPDPGRVCVIAGTAGYIVKVDEPAIWEEIVIPVLGVQPVAKRELLVFWDFTGLAAYGKNGLVWRSKRLCWDELKIRKMTDDTIEG
jgi:hypothetical protein